MQAERWRTVREVLAAVLELEPAERPAYLLATCSGDPNLLAEVQSLLNAYERGGSALDHPAAPIHVLSPGDRLDIYEVEELIGVGGMGEVYRAIDTSLHRSVAIKVLPAIFSTDAARLARLEREARAAAALNHPNILAIHRLDTHQGTLYIVSELLQGSTLRALLKQQRLTLESSLNYALQIASGLAAAHSKGIIHRDIKPENLFVTEFGQVKILDFGLAKAVEVLHESGAGTVERHQHETLEGTALGTVAYMSPEQARGGRVGPQSDIFSLGIVLYEMTTGALPFPGSTAAVISEGILNRNPVPPRSLNPHLPPSFEDIIRRALEKNVARRYQNASEIRSDLQNLERTAQPTTVGGLSWPKRRWKTLVVAVLLVGAALGGFFARHNRKHLTEKDTAVLADFTNTTGDSIFDGTLRQGLSAELEQSPFLNLLSDRQVARTLSLMAQPKGAPLTPELAGEVCQRTASTATIEGSISSLGSQYVLGLKAVNCHDGEVLAEEQVTAGNKEQVLQSLGKAANRIRAKLGESLASVQKYDTPLENVTTPSLEALQAYTLAYQAQIVKDDSGAAVPLLQHAVSLDPNFAMAYARLGTDYANLGQAQRAAENLRKAFELRDRVSEREKLYIASHYEQFVTGNIEAASKINDLWAQTYPRDTSRMGVIYVYLGEYDKFLATCQENLKINPGSASAYENLVVAYLEQNRLDEAQQTAQQAVAHHVDSAALHLDLYQVDFLQHDFAGMNREAAVVMGSPGDQPSMFAFESDTAASGGEFSQARRLTQRASDSAKRNADNEAAASYEAEAAVREALVGNFALARQQANAALALSHSKDGEAISAIALGLSGSSQSRELAGDLDSRFPADTIVQLRYLPMIEAAQTLSGSQKQVERGIESLAKTAPYELGGTALAVSFDLYGVYLRGLSYLALRQGATATVEFQKIVDHPGIAVNEPIGSLAHLGLGRAYALAGDTSKARTAYQEFFTLWKNADGDLPLLMRAKAEYAKLTRDLQGAKHAGNSTSDSAEYSLQSCKDRGRLSSWRRANCLRGGGWNGRAAPSCRRLASSGYGRRGGCPCVQPRFSPPAFRATRRLLGRGTRWPHCVFRLLW